jgi:hypothetical protein
MIRDSRHCCGTPPRHDCPRRCAGRRQPPRSTSYQVLRRKRPQLSGISYPVSRHNSQERCPFSIRFSEAAAEPAFAARAPGEPPFGVQIEPGASRSRPGTASPSLIDLLATALDDAAWDAFSRGSAMRRSGRAGFARNVCVGLGNWGSPAAVPVLSRALSDPEPLVRAHAAWALGRVGSTEARSALSRRVSVEADATVLAELSAALGADSSCADNPNGRCGQDRTPVKSVLGSEPRRFSQRSITDSESS